MSTLNNILVIIPAFNEQTAIGGVIDGLLENGYRPVVIDDCSSDRTSQVAVAHGATVFRHPVNLGQGAALETGRQFALNHGADYICTFDADGQHDASDISNMKAILVEHNADMVVGSRFSGEAISIPANRKFILKLAVLFHRLFYGIDLTDTHNGLRIFTREAAEKISIESPRMAHATEILSKAHKMGLKVVEAPVTINYTQYSLEKGQNFLSSFAIIKDLILKELFK